MIVLETKVRGYLIRLSEELENKKMIGRSVYNLRIDKEEGGMYIMGIGEDMDEALAYHTAYVEKAMKGEKVW